MTHIFRRRTINVSRVQGPWLMLLLLLAVLVPSVCLLWFMGQAVRNERLASRQKLAEAYRGYLSLAQEQWQNTWRERANTVRAAAAQVPARSLFAKCVNEGIADSVIVFDDNGRVVYPDMVPPPVEMIPPVDWAKASRLEWTEPGLAAAAYAEIAVQATNSSQAAQALQAQLRCLIRAGDQASAIQIVTGTLAEERFRDAADFQGRLIVPNAQLMALELLGNPTSDEAKRLRESLQQRLSNYVDDSFPSAQRRLLMRELQRLYPQNPVSPLLAAEDLAAAWLEADANSPRESKVTASLLPDVWQFPLADGRAVALFRTETLLEQMRGGSPATALPEGVPMQVLAPGREVTDVLATLPVGPAFPGWRLAFASDDAQLLETATQQRITGYLWTGVLALATVVVLAVLALGMVRRQAALSQLRNDLVANVTHELKTPLSSMRLLVDTLLDTPTLEEKTTREYLELIARENLRLSRLIDNFLTFSRIERNKYRFDFQTVPARTIAESAAAAVRERFNTPDCSFEVRLAPELPTVVVDVDALVTALVNLLDNAWKYSGDHKRIVLTAAAEEGAVVFKVADNGIGLMPRDVRRIFSRFYRVEPHRARIGGGCGLGLSIVKFVVTAHQGTVRVESEPNRGSTFVISIPAKAAHHEQGAKP